MKSSSKFLIFGLFFSALWASAAVAGKIGIKSVEPLVLFNIRFLLAGTAMLLYAYAIKKSRFPKGQEWAQLALFGLLNTTLYLGLFILAIKQVSAGIGSLSTATNPLIISLLSAVWIGRKIRSMEWYAIFLGMAGVALATYPLLKNSNATIQGLLLIMASMVCYSIGTIYYSKINWKLPALVINGWQVFIGGVIILPFSFLMHQKEHINHFDLRFWSAEFWLIVPVSIISVQLWLWLLKSDTIKASLWLFLCPVFGFFYAAILLNERISYYTVIGTFLVIAGLYLGQKNKLVANKIDSNIGTVKGGIMESN